MSNKSHNILHTELESLSVLCDSKQFLGREFLTWIWFLSENTEHQLKLTSPKEGVHLIDIWIDDRVVLESVVSGAGFTTTIRGGSVSQSPEASTSLISGKLLKEARICIIVDSLFEFSFVLNHTDLFPKNIKLPEPTEENNSSAYYNLSHRIKMIELLLQIIDDLYSKFIFTRTDSNWMNDSDQTIKVWIQKKHNLLKLSTQ